MQVDQQQSRAADVVAGVERIADLQVRNVAAVQPPEDEVKGKLSQAPPREGAELQQNNRAKTALGPLWPLPNASFAVKKSQPSHALRIVPKSAAESEQVEAPQYLRKSTSPYSATATASASASAASASPPSETVWVVATCRAQSFNGGLQAEVPRCGRGRRVQVCKCMMYDHNMT